MLLVRASVRPSATHGMGCFTEEKIEQGQVVWVFDERIDIRMPVSELPSLPPPAQEFLHMYGYEELHAGQGAIVLCGDHAKHMNHSDTPNLSEGEDYTNIAARGIEPGEELTCNYFEFDRSAGRKLSVGPDLGSHK